MYETEEQIAELQELLDRSHAGAGDHTLSIITPERRLSARQLVRYLRGTRHLVVGTVTSKGEPRVGPVDGHFLRGRFYFGTGGNAYRIKHLRRNAAISASHVVGDDIAITMHGRAVLMNRGEGNSEELRAHWTQVYGEDPYGWSSIDPVWVRIEPRVMLTFALDPEKYPE